MYHESIDAEVKKEEDPIEAIYDALTIDQRIDHHDWRVSPPNSDSRPDVRRTRGDVRERRSSEGGS